MKKICSIFLLAFILSFPAQAATNKEFRIGIDQEFETLNPIIMQMSASRYIGDMANHTLVSIDADWKWACWLCVEMPTLENGKARIIEENGVKKIVADWEIKPGANWGDGTPVTGKDVLLGWEIGNSPNVSVAEKDLFQRIEAVTVDPTNPKKFSLKYKQARYDFAFLGTFYLLPDHLERAVWEKTKGTVGEYEKQTKYSTDSTNPGLYCGPYTVNEIQLGSHVILTPNAHFYGEAPKIQKVIFKLIPDTATLEANLLSGTIDMVSELGFTLDQALAFEKRVNADPALKAKYQVIFRDGPIYEHIDLQLNNPILKDVRVRQALVYAIDRDKLTQALFQNKQKKAIHDMHPLDPYYTEAVTLYPYDPAKAATLLEEAGWVMGSDGYRHKDGQKLSLVFMTTAQDKTREKVQVYLQSEWKKVGVEITIKNEPARVYFGETIRKGKYPALAMFAWTSSPDNPPRSILHSSEIPTEANGYSGQNTGGWVNPVVDKNYDDVLLEFDINKRKEMVHAVLNEYTREVPVIPLYYRAEIAVVPTHLKNFRVTGHQFYSSNAAEKWTLE